MKKLRELVEKWRAEAQQDLTDAYNECLLNCADELETLLAAVPVEEAAPHTQGGLARRPIKQLRDVLSMLCNYIWTKELRPGEHLWSIPVDKNRDFDCILSDAINELECLRASPSPVAGAVPAPPSRDSRYFDEQGNYLDGPHYGKDCPKGMVQVAFLGADPKLQFSPYSWKPEVHVFIELSIDGETWRIDVGDYEASCQSGKRRGLHVNGPFKMCVDKHSINAVDLYRSEQDEIPRKRTAAERANVRDAERAVIAGQDETRQENDDLTRVHQTGQVAHSPTASGNEVE